MKILCIARNYARHAREMGNPLPDEPVVFLKPSTALLATDKPFVIPDFSKCLHFEAELVFRICRRLSKVGEKSAADGFNAFTIGIDFTARDLQNSLREKGLPWEKAKGFDGSAAVGRFVQVEKNANSAKVTFHLNLNGKTVQKAAESDMIFPVPLLIAHLSRYFTLEPGDLLFTGTPEGVGSVKSGDLLEGFVNHVKLLELHVK